jgi:hypothetical protein
VAGDLCQAAALEPTRKDLYSAKVRSRVLRFRDEALARYARVLLVAGNHEHYEGVFEETAGLLRQHLTGVSVLDNDTIEIGGICFFGSTLWTDFDRASTAAMDGVRRRVGDYFFIRQHGNADARGRPPRFQPETALAAFEASWASLRRCVHASVRGPLVVITHHAPSRQGLNPLASRSSVAADRLIDHAYASDLDAEIARWQNVPVWVHGHTHIRRRYAIGGTRVLANCLGFADADPHARHFTPGASFEI